MQDQVLGGYRVLDLTDQKPASWLVAWSPQQTSSPRALRRMYYANGNWTTRIWWRSNQTGHAQALYPGFGNLIADRLRHAEAFQRIIVPLHRSCVHL